MAWDENGDGGFGGTRPINLINPYGNPNAMYGAANAPRGGGSAGPGVGGIRAAAPAASQAQQVPAGASGAGNPLIQLLTPAVAFGSAAGTPAGGAAAAGGMALLFKYIDKKYGKQIQNWLDPMVPAHGEPAGTLPGSAPQATPAQFGSAYIPQNPQDAALPDPSGFRPAGAPAPKQAQPIPPQSQQDAHGWHFTPPQAPVVPPQSNVPTSIYMDPYRRNVYMPEETTPGVPDYQPRMVRKSQWGFE